MSVLGAKRPAQNATVRKPRRDRSADQMELNGALIRTENSDSLYKAIVIDLVSEETGRDLSWALTLEDLKERPFSARRQLLEEATLLWCAAIVRLTADAGGSVSARSAAIAIRRRVRVLEGKRRMSRQDGGDVSWRKRG